MNETVNPVINQKFDEFVRSRRWWEQFCELVISASSTIRTEVLLFHTRSVTVRDLRWTGC